ncbi:MAG TPA: glycoside hydrolase family 15 protein [Stellaceae bacterium]|nr:glycoside hydrolase family 15 protein [Stellaceae bacterium]
MATLADILDLAPGVRLGEEVGTPPGDPIPDRAVQPYRPIRDYALIGDCHGAALVARDGAIDWACLGRFDAAPVFTRLLDAKSGGFLHLAPLRQARSARRYLDESAILVTHFADEGGRANVIDFMPVGHHPDARRHDATRLNAPGWIVRIAIGVAGRLGFEMRYRPVLGLKKMSAPTLACDGGVATGKGVPALHATVPITVSGGEASARFELTAGDVVCFIVAPAAIPHLDPLGAANRLLGTTRRFWQDWIGTCRYEGAHAAMVRRSAVTLKLLTFAPTGAIVAAPTTSLPERIGGPRNFDYRYCWLRDAAYMLYALTALGYGAEAQAYVEFLHQRHLRRKGVHLMFSVAGELVPEEEDLTSLSGYRDSGPVRIGNAAAKQRQLDIFGETIDLAYLYEALGGRLNAGERSALVYLADCAAQGWRERDNGIWEIRSERQHFVYSKIMCWVALDRAARMFGDRPSWAEAQRAICQAVHEEGVINGHLVGAFGRTGMDAALLITPWLGFPLREGVMARTLDAILDELGEGHYLRRYRTEDGMGGEEGAFLMSSFWFAGALLHQGAHDAAAQLFDRMVTKANDVGLYSEEIDPQTEAFLGNFPQGFVHLAVITLATHFELYRSGGSAALAGSHADRAQRHIKGGRLFGPFGRLRDLAAIVGGAPRRSVLILP